MEKYQKKVFPDVVISKDQKFELESGTHAQFESLNLMKGGTIIVKSQDNWYKSNCKWFIIEVKNDFYFEGSIIAKDWTNPKVKEFLVEDTIMKEFDIKILSDDEKCVSVSHKYIFNNGGKGGNGSSGRSDSVGGSYVPGGLGGNGDFLYGGGGGVGFQENSTSEQHNSSGYNGEILNGGAGGGGNNHWGPVHGGKGGDGGINSNVGIGGLVLIICHGNLYLNNELMDVSGSKGGNGNKGNESMVNTPGGNPEPVPCGAGGGGGGAAGTPGGKICIRAKNIFNKEKFQVNIRGGEGGEGGKEGFVHIIKRDSQPGAVGDTGNSGYIQFL